MKRTLKQLKIASLVLLFIPLIWGCSKADDDIEPGNDGYIPDYKDCFRVLAIGNSFSRDAMTFMYDMAVENGADKQGIDLTNAYIGGCTLAMHAQNAKYDLKAYTRQSFKAKGVITEVDGVSLRSMIERNDWDIITLQQASQDSGKSATYNADIAYLIDYIKQYATNPNVIIGWHMTWAYAPYSNHANFPDYGSNQMTMYNAIINAVRNTIVPDDSFAFVIPAGTAIQNARSTFGETLNWQDGYHLNQVGQFIAGAMWIRTITGWDVDVFDTYAPAGLTRGAISRINKCVQDAFSNPYVVTPQ
jgi:hypothetical protein